jgi:hydrogenase expression/formation protein HypC
MCLAIPGRVEDIVDEGVIRMGRVNFGGVVKRVCLDYVPEVGVGDYVLVHVGFAISMVDETTAKETLEMFGQMGVLEEELASEEETFARAAERQQSNCPDGSCETASRQASESASQSSGEKAGPSTPVAAATSAQDDSLKIARSAQDGSLKIARSAQDDRHLVDDNLFVDEASEAKART